MIYIASLTETLEEKLEKSVYIKSLEELDRVALKEKESSVVRIKKDFTEKYFSGKTLVKYIDNVSKLNPRIRFEVESSTVSNQTADHWAKKIMEMDDLIELQGHLMHTPDVCLSGLKALASAYQNTADDSLRSSRQLSELLFEIDKLNVEIANLNHELKLETLNKNQISNRLASLVNTLTFRYNKDMKLDNIFSTSNFNYDKVLYIKEDTKVRYVDTLVYYLKETLRVIHSMPTRVLIIEPFYAQNTIKLHQGLKPHYNLTEGDVLKSDILMLGIQVKLLERILKNPRGTSFLIILDRSQIDGYCVYSDRKDIEYLRTASHRSDLPEGFPLDRVIGYEKDVMQTIDFIKNFDYMDSTERMRSYTAMPIVKNIINLLEATHTKESR